MSVIRMKRVIPGGLLCLGVFAAMAAAEHPRPFRLWHENPVTIMPVKKASAARAPLTSGYDRDDSSDESAAVRAAVAVRLAALRNYVVPEATQEASILPWSAVDVLGGCLIAALGAVFGVRVWKKKFAKRWAEAVRPEAENGPCSSSAGSSQPMARRVALASRQVAFPRNRQQQRARAA